MHRGQIIPTYVKSLTPICLFIYNSYGSTIVGPYWPCVKDHTLLSAHAQNHFSRKWDGKYHIMIVLTDHDFL